MNDIQGYQNGPIETGASRAKEMSPRAYNLAMSAKTYLIGCRTNAVNRQAKPGGRDNFVDRKATAVDPADGDRHDLSARKDASHDVHILLVHAPSFAVCLSIFPGPYYRTHVCIL